ncbi:MAG: PrpF domain-containing protein, partial [Burkholderiales bacterium]
FALDDGLSAVDGDLAIPGVAGTGSPVRLEFREPGGATTGKLLPTGNVIDTLEVPGAGRLRVSMVDAANACVFVSAADIGLSGTEMPETLDNSPEILKKLAAIRVAASVAMGIAGTPEEAAKKSAVPFVGFVSPPQDARLLTGEHIGSDAVDLTARMISNGQPHRALPLTASLCMAVAARLAGSVVHRATRASGDPESEIRIAMPSGVLTVAASVKQEDGRWHAEQGAFYRTQRRMFEGHVLVRASRVPGLVAAGGGERKAA